MSANLSNAQRSPEVRTLDQIRRQPAKAQLQSPSASAPSDDVLLERLSRTVESALLDAHGSLKAIAIEIGMDPSQLRRQFKLGTFDLRTLAAAGERGLQLLGEALRDEFPSKTKPEQQIRAKAKVALMQLLDLMEPIDE